MNIYDLYMHLKQYNVAMAKNMYENLDLNLTGRIEVGIDTDDDFWIDFQSEEEEKNGEFLIPSVESFKEEVIKRLLDIPESRYRAVMNMIDKADRNLQRVRGHINHDIEQERDYYFNFPWGNWGIDVTFVAPVRTYMLFGQKYDITEEAFNKIREDVQCLNSQDESAQ